MIQKQLTILVILASFWFLQCATDEDSITINAPKPVGYFYKGCTFSQADRECSYFVTYDESVKRRSEPFFHQRNDVPDKNSVTQCSLGSCIEGNCLNGKGTLSFPQGSRLEGIFKNGKLNGTGSYSGCGEKYTGTFKDNRKDNGRLSYTFNNQVIEYYDGQFKNEMRNGKGLYYRYYGIEDYKNQIFYSGEYVYEGNWENDLRNGTFTAYSIGSNFTLTDNKIKVKYKSNTAEKHIYSNDKDVERIERENLRLLCRASETTSSKPCKEYYSKYGEYL